MANLFIGDFTLALGLDIAWDPVHPSVYHEIFEVIANLGVIFLLFAVGMETKICDLRSVGRTAMWVAVLGVIIPFILGFTLVFGYETILFPHDDWFIHALFMAAAMVATCIGITARVLTEMKVMDSIESRIIIGAAVVDDILAMIVLAVVVGIAGSSMGGGELSLISIGSTILIALVFVAVVLLLCLKMPKVKEKRVCQITERGISCQDRNWPLSVEPFPLAMLTCLGLSAMALSLGLAAIIGAFLAGMLFAEFAHERLENKFNGINAFLVPFFFVYVGMRVELAGFTDILPLAIGTIILAILGKYVAGYIGVLSTQKKKDKKTADIVGIGMSPRGEVGIIVAAIGLTAGAISRDMYTVVVFMSIVTALIAPPWLARSFKKKYGDKLFDSGKA
ncbi:MAG: cation:proton antiporter [Candidatus Methanomethylophilaceae archaeon]|nr:cation:proton antiporter [Candidatus Methanomethylophilaceae archaeon]